MCFCAIHRPFMHRNCILSKVVWGESAAQLDGKLVPTLAMRDSHAISLLPAAFDCCFCLLPWSDHFVRLKYSSSTDCLDTHPFTSILCLWTICWQILHLSSCVSQNRRTAEAARALWPTPAPAGTPRAGGPGPWPGGFWTSARRILHSLWAICASAPEQHSSAVLPGAQREPPCFGLCSLLLVLALGTTEKSQAPPSWHVPFRYL